MSQPVHITDAEKDQFREQARELVKAYESALVKAQFGATAETWQPPVRQALHNLRGLAALIHDEPLQQFLGRLDACFAGLCRAGATPGGLDHLLRGGDAVLALLDGKPTSFDPATVPGSRADNAISLHRLARSRKSVREQTPPRILVVDDEPDIVEIVTTLLTETGFETSGHTDPHRALEAIASFAPDAVVTDIAMPRLGGIELLRAIRAQEAELPVIFVSGYVTKETLLEAIGDGVFAVIEKPFDSKTVVSQCTAAVRQYRLTQLLNRSINLLLFSYSDLDELLEKADRKPIRDIIRAEMNALLEQRRQLRTTGRKKTA